MAQYEKVKCLFDFILDHFSLGYRGGGRNLASHFAISLKLAPSFLTENPPPLSFPVDRALINPLVGLGWVTPQVKRKDWAEYTPSQKYEEGVIGLFSSVNYKNKIMISF